MKEKKKNVKVCESCGYTRITRVAKPKKCPWCGRWEI